MAGALLVVLLWLSASAVLSVPAIWLWRVIDRAFLAP